MLVTTLNRNILRQIAIDIENAVKGVEEEHGIVIKYGGASFSSTSATIKFDLALIKEGSTAQTPAAATLESLSPLIGIKMGQQFKTWNGKTYEVVGYKPRNHKYPVIAIDVVTGKRFKFPLSAVKG